MGELARTILTKAKTTTKDYEYSNIGCIIAASILEQHCDDIYENIFKYHMKLLSMNVRETENPMGNIIFSTKTDMFSDDSIKYIDLLSHIIPTDDIEMIKKNITEKTDQSFTYPSVGDLPQIMYPAGLAKFIFDDLSKYYGRRLDYVKTYGRRRLNHA